MSTLQNEIKIFGTENQKSEAKSLSWFISDKHRYYTSNDDFNSLLYEEDLSKGLIFVSLYKPTLQRFIKYLSGKIQDKKIIESFHRFKPALFSYQDIKFGDEKAIVDDLFNDIIIYKPHSSILLNKDEMMFVLAKPKPDRRDRVISVQILNDVKMIRILMGDLKVLYVPTSILRANSKGEKPNFSDIEIMEYGYYLRFGRYEASVSGILYECDKEYRLRRKKERIETEISFGSCLRRYRIQKKIKQTDFKNISEKTVRRIESGEEVTDTAKRKILKELNILEDELLTY
ncbi:MAG: helix-turn-helix transcriptional regulator [Leptospiraceae bacterium]|nr:helix-turn-helix transcriptional regulator [Leptospiraceae bacterium]